METHDQQLQFNRQPFEESVDPVFFFPGGARREIVDEIKGALLGGVSLITLIGPEGSGKTMICRMVEKELPTGLCSVFLPRTVDSFGDMVEIVGREVISDPVLQEIGSTEELLRAIAESLRERGQRLLIVFEEAEKIYLATLERIRKMLDPINENGLLLHLLFSARPQLSESLEQLSIVAFQEIEECNLVLDDVDQETARAYLNHRLAVATGKQHDLLPTEMVADIYSASGGNFRKINQLAGEYLQSEQKDAPFLVLLDTVDGTQGKERNRRPRRSRTTPGMPKVDLDFLALPKMRGEWLFYGGGVAAVVVLLFLFWSRFSDNSESQQDLSGVPVIELREVDPLTGGDTVEPIAVTEPAPVDETATSSAVAQPSGSEAGVPEQAPAQEEQSVSATETERGSTTAGAATEETAGRAEPPTTTVTEETAGRAEPPTTTVTEETAGRAEPPTTTITEETAGRDEPPTSMITEETAGGDESSTVAAGEVEAVRQLPVASTVASETTEATGVPETPELTVEEAVARPILLEKKLKRLPSRPADGGDNGTVVDTRPAIEDPVAAVSAEEPTAAAVDPTPKDGAAQSEETSELPVIREPTDKKEIVQPSPVRILDEEEKLTTLLDPERSPTAPLAAIVTDDNSLYKERLAAGARWLVGGGSGKFTVQLMVLTSDLAEENLKQIFADQNYRAIADDLFVLRRLGSPPTVMLYYGEYRTLAAAQQARNTLPVFLRKHDPYPISVTAAVEKTRTLP